MILSFLFLIVEPISALMLLALVLRHRHTLGIHRYARFFLAILAGGLVLHAAGQVEILMHYRPPRTYAWVPMYLALNGAIWTSYLTDRYRRKRA